MRSNNNREWRIINLTRLLVDAERLTKDAAAERLVIALQLGKAGFLSVCYMLQLEMWASAQRGGRPAEYRWRPLFNAAKFG